MSHIFQSGAVYGLTTVLTAGSYLLDRLNASSVLDLHMLAANVTPMTDYPMAFYIRRDRKDKQKQIKVFASGGVQKYTIERLSALHPVWKLMTYPQRQEVATINAGFSHRSVDFHNKPGISHRDITGDAGVASRYRSFYLNDGAKYSWTRGSKFLEKVINPNGGVEEKRERVARVKLMRQFKFDFEMLVDVEKIDPEVALATGFVSMLTQWGIGESTDTVGPTFIAKKPTPEVAPEQQVVFVVEDSDEEDQDDADSGIIVTLF